MSGGQTGLVSSHSREKSSQSRAERADRGGPGRGREDEILGYDPVAVWSLASLFFFFFSPLSSRPRTSASDRVAPCHGQPPGRSGIGLETWPDRVHRVRLVPVLKARARLGPPSNVVAARSRRTGHVDVSPSLPPPPQPNLPPRSELAKSTNETATSACVSLAASAGRRECAARVRCAAVALPAQRRPWVPWSGNVGSVGGRPPRARPVAGVRAR